MMIMNIFIDIVVKDIFLQRLLSRWIFT